MSIVLVFLRQRLAKLSIAILLFSCVIFITQMIAFFNVYSPALLEKNVNHLSVIIFIISSVYAVLYLEFFKTMPEHTRHNIYRWGGYFLCFYLFLELISRLFIGSIGMGLLYGFKKSLFYFDSNFIGMMIMSFIMFFFYVRNIGGKGFGIIILLLVLLLILTMSRAAIIATIICMGVFYSHKTYKWKSYVVLVFYFFVFFALAYIYLFDSFSFQDFDGSFNSKFYIISKAMELYDTLPLSSLLFGVGLGNFDKYTGIFAHNIFVTVIMEMGIVGTISFLCFITYSVSKSNSAALYIWLPTLICGISLFGVYTPYLFLINTAIVLESKKQIS
ncbi:O-antigen ligase family protein [Aeromonas allosaccharophila]|uniref:O-antigen ligase family protein n=1 Tax=Aeromonas allosaccharophila TaxID=656 RepID=UPI00300604DB